ncbi:MAG TPA: glycoside hydrolase family 9 protein [Puia sp.]|nr:glycoside hydrolase family 9 protein [Puia sp.]
MRISIALSILVTFSFRMAGQSIPVIIQSIRLTAQSIRINQLGYYPHAPKIAIVTFSPGSVDAATTDQPFYLLSPHGHDTAYTGPEGPPDTVYTGRLGPLQHSTNSSVTTRIADFSAITKEGVYEIAVPDIGTSYPFRIGPHAAEQVARASLKGYYYQRSAMALDFRYAGQWSRPSGHPDTAVLVHPSAASDQRPAGTILSTPGGWYDAGDYNKYIVNSGITMGTLLSAYEDFPDYYDTLHTNIPPITGATPGSSRATAGAPASATTSLASGSSRATTAPAATHLPDILNEALYNLRWMLTMQDPADGGVYNKCTNAAFDSMVMPSVTRKPRYVVQKGTAATLDFAAVMAQAARILRKFHKQLPGLSDSCLRAAGDAWNWAANHPALVYDQDVLNKSFEPKIVTGGYGDRDFKDEWFWAAVELMVTTNIAQSVSRNSFPCAPPFIDMTEQRIGDSAGLPSWANVHMLGVYTLLRFRKKLPEEWQPAIREVSQRLLQMADDYSAREQTNAFHTVMGGSQRDFIWGSNAVAANQGILLINAWLLTKDRKYIDNALGNLDYLLGRNATGYCFITGMGSYSTMHPHHRPSVADGIVPPVPGLLAGGPNPGRQDHQQYKFTEPETAYLDQDQAYASNEIAINWNAPLVYLSGALEALQVRVGYSSATITPRRP